MHKIRSQYPILEKYTYLNTAYHGMFSQELIQYQRELSMRMYNEASLFVEHRAEFLHEVKSTIAHFYRYMYKSLLPSS